MTDIRAYLNWDSGYSPINREERNLAAILYHVLLLSDNLGQFLDLIECPFEVVESEMGIFLEYAYVRDLWSQIDDNDIKRGLILELLKPAYADALRKTSVLKFNRYFGAVPRASARYIQSPGLWSVRSLDKTVQDDYEFLKTCMFKWAFNAKPDIVIHTSRDDAVCIEAKLESSEGHYPQSGVEKKVFRSRGLEYVRQTELQKYLMEELLGIRTRFVFLVQKAGQTSDTHRVLLWKDAFKSLEVGGVPEFMLEMIDAHCPGAAENSN